MRWWVVALLVVAGCGGNGSLARPSTTTTAGPFGTATSASASDSTASNVASLTGLAVGQCFDVDQFAAGVPIDPTQAHPRSCTEPHQHEVYAVFAHPDPPGAAWPGDAAIDAWVDDRCLAQFEGYVGISYERSTLDMATIRPDKASWKQGDRTVACTLHDVDFATLIASMKAASR